MVHIPVNQAQVAAFCRQHYIRKLAFFGSVLRPDFRADSDVDILVEFEVGHVPGFLALASMEQELSELLGHRTVDLRTPHDLSRSFRDDVLASAEVHYAVA